MCGNTTRPGSALRIDPLWKDELRSAVVVDPGLPSVLVQQAMVGRAQHHQVAQVRRPAAGPVNAVMRFGSTWWVVTSREGASSISGEQCGAEVSLSKAAVKRSELPKRHPNAKAVPHHRHPLDTQPNRAGGSGCQPPSTTRRPRPSLAARFPAHNPQLAGTATHKCTPSTRQSSLRGKEKPPPAAPKH